MSDYSEINTRSGLRGKRNITLLDRSITDEKKGTDKSNWGTKMDAVLWGEVAKNPKFDVGDLVGI